MSKEQELLKESTNMYKAKLDDIYDNYLIMEKASGDETGEEDTVADDNAGAQMKMQSQAFDKAQAEIRELFS